MRLTERGYCKTRRDVVTPLSHPHLQSSAISVTTRHDSSPRGGATLLPNYKNERMTTMELDQMLTAAANYGFPMLVSCYLLVRMENKIDQLSANIDALTRVIAAAK